MPAFLCSVPLPVSRPLFLFCRMLSGLFVCLFPGIGCRLSSFCSRVFSRALFLCPVPRGIPRFFFLLFPGIGCRCSSPSMERWGLPFYGSIPRPSRDHYGHLRPVLSSSCSRVFSPAPPFVHSPALNAGVYFVHCAMENCLDLAIRTGGTAGSDAPTQTLIRLYRLTG